MNLADFDSIINYAGIVCDSEEVAVDAMDRSLTITGQAILVGSRRVLKGLPVSTDYDYMMIECAENRKFLEDAGFEISNTVTAYFDKYTMVIYKKENTQVTLKNPNYWQSLINFWNFLEENPKMFERFVWKSSVEFPKHSENIKEFIELFVPNYGKFLGRKQ